MTSTPLETFVFKEAGLVAVPGRRNSGLADDLLVAIRSFCSRRTGLRGSSVTLSTSPADVQKARLSSATIWVRFPEKFAGSLKVAEGVEPHLIVQTCALNAGGAVKMTMNHVASGHDAFNGVAAELGGYLRRHKKVGAHTVVYLSPRGEYPISRVF
ncbi:TPA: hypothetical protein HA244_00565 [Candidatus Micrarchaeota archaeon]|nr:hypothetical protein [Candidatus Micrarchaeota archaeon]